MGDLIVLKGNQDGLLLKMDQTAPLYELHKALKEKLIASKQFFGKQNVVLTLAGRHLLDEDATKLIELIQEYTDLTITQLKEQSISNEPISSGNQEESIVAKKTGTRTRKKKSINKEKSTESKVASTSTLLTNNDEDNDSIKPKASITNSNRDTKKLALSNNLISSSPSNNFKKQAKVDSKILGKEHTAQIRYGTLRSGQELYFEDSVIYIGNVHIGAKITAKGHIIIIGNLLGSVHAGYGGNYKAFVMASKMKPTQIRIGKVIARSPDDQEDINLSRIAFVEDEHICIEEIDQKLFNDLSIIKS